MAPYIRLHLNCREVPATGCWEWQGRTGSSGYGLIKVFGRMRSVHEYSHELHKGPVPEGLEVLHSCDNKLCWNPDHLSVGTHQKNMQEAKERGLMLSGERHPAFGKPNPRRGIKSAQSNPVVVCGKYYGSQKEAEKALNLGSGTVRYWLKSGSSKAKSITREEFQNAQ